MTESRSTHPSDEWLVAYLTTGLSHSELGGLDRHLQGCDLCVASLSTMSRRLSMASDVSVPVPAIVLARGAAPAPEFSPTPVQHRPRWMAAVLDRVSSVFCLPVLVPVAVAATALVVLVSQSNVTGPAPQQERSRAVGIRDTLPVTAPEAQVWQEPGSASQGGVEKGLVATIKRGTRVAVVAEKGVWYQVTLPDGRTGWVQRHAFE